MRGALALACTCRALVACLHHLPQAQLQGLARRGGAACRVLASRKGAPPQEPSLFTDTLAAVLRDVGPGAPTQEGAHMSPAAAHGLAQVLLQLGAEPDAVMLGYAAAAGSTTLCTLLLDTGGLQGGQLALSAAVEAAAQEGHAELCAFLLQCGAGHHGPVDNFALWKAAEKGHTDVCRLLVKHGWDSGHCVGWSLREAARHGRIEVCRELLSQPLHANVPLYRGMALSAAAEAGHLEVCRALLQHGVYDFSRQDAHRAAEAAGHAQVCKLLSSRRAKAGCIPLTDNREDAGEWMEVLGLGIMLLVMVVCRVFFEDEEQYWQGPG